MTIEVKGCNDKAIKGIEIELTLDCQTEHVTMRTGEDGKATFKVCWKDVTEEKIGGFVKRKIAPEDSASVKKNVTVTVNICSPE